MNELNSLVDVRADLLDVQLLVAAGQELLVIGDVEEVNFEVQVHGWSLPELENFAVVAVHRKFL